MENDGGDWVRRTAGASRERLVSLVSSALQRGGFGEAEALRVLRHPFCSEEAIRLVLLSREAMRSSAVRKGVAIHPAAPRADALRAVEELGWRDLADVGRSTRTPPAVRRAASRRVAERLVRLAKGERVALGRIADRDLLGLLLRDREPEVVSAALQNPRLLPEDLEAWIAASPHPGSLSVVAENLSWRCRPPLRAALLRCRATPPGAVITLLRASTPAELRVLADEPSTPRLTAAWALRMLEAGGEETAGRTG